MITALLINISIFHDEEKECQRKQINNKISN